MKLVPPDDPILHRVIPKFTGNAQELKEIAQEMLSFMKSNNGIGLSANQVGLELNMFVMGGIPKVPDYIVINPVMGNITSSYAVEQEGCLSFPYESYDISRPKNITVSYTNIDNRKVTQALNGLWARCFMHEMDHLHGITFQERANQEVFTVAGSMPK